jgi:hypothetical protein
MKEFFNTICDFKIMLVTSKEFNIICDFKILCGDFEGIP